MRLQGLLGLFILLNQSDKRKILFGFQLKNTLLAMTQPVGFLSSCALAEPRLAYKNTHFEVAEEIDVLSNNSEAWIGYLSVKIPYLFHGCAHVLNSTTYSVIRIGYCQTLCGHNRPFGIKAQSGGDILNPASEMECMCFNTSVHEIKTGHFDNNQNNLCNIDWYAIFSHISVNDSMVINSGTENIGDCLTYKFRSFQWKSCTSLNNLKVICSDKTTTGPSARAYVKTQYSDTWINGNLICLNENMYPASISSIVLSGLNEGQQHEHWTGILRAATLINKADISRFGPRQFSDPEYAFLQGSNKRLHFANIGEKKALCCKGANRESCVPTSTEIPNQTEKEATTTKSKEESQALGAGIGVLVVVLVVVGIGFAVFILRRRGSIHCGTKHQVHGETNDKHDDRVPNTASTVARVDNSVVNQNVFVLKKQTDSEIEQIDHNNTPGDPKDIEEENNYHYIDGPAEPRGNFKGDCSEYDFTTDRAATPRDLTHDNVYNKLKLDRQGNYEHVKGSCQIHNNTTKNDYDTTATLKAISAHGNDDYDHVSGIGHAPALSSSESDYSSTEKFAAHARGTVAELDRPDDSHGQNPFVKV